MKDSDYKKKKILITGANSYIGTSYMHYASVHYKDKYIIDEVDVKTDSWMKLDFSEYDVIYHVAGIAHSDIGRVSDEIRKMYYRVNTELAINVAEKAKRENVKLFILMSSMIVYGDAAPYGVKKIITKDTIPKPNNFYGESKYIADCKIREMADDSFHVVVLRPPMIYGPGSKGNYPFLAKIASRSPFFPKAKNQRSMLFVENLCELLCQLMQKDITECAVVMCPQNAEWSNTSDVVKKIATAKHRYIYLSKLLSLGIIIGSKIPGKIGTLTNKAFGNFCYEKEMSVFEGITYQKVNLADSIIKTEGQIN